MPRKQWSRQNRKRNKAHFQQQRIFAKPKVRKVADTTGTTHKMIDVDKTTIKDLAQKITAKGEGSKGTGGTGKIDSDLIKKYIRDIEQRTDRELPKNQMEKLKEALRNKEYQKLTPSETRKHRRGFNKVKNKLIEEWEVNTDQKWPTYSKDVISEKTGEPIRRKGDKFDAHHIIENSFLGEHEWWNLHPAKFPNEHQSGIHGTGSPANELFNGGK